MLKTEQNLVDAATHTKPEMVDVGLQYEEQLQEKKAIINLASSKVIHNRKPSEHRLNYVLPSAAESSD